MRIELSFKPQDLWFGVYIEKCKVDNVPIDTKFDFDLNNKDIAADVAKHLIKLTIKEYKNNEFDHLQKWYYICRKDK